MSLISFQIILFICEGIISYGYKNMNWTFAVIGTLIKSNMKENCLINFLMNMSTKGLKYYLECVSTHRGTSTKKKIDLIEMIVYGCMTGTLNKKDWSIKRHINKTSKSNTNEKQHNNKFFTWTLKYKIKEKRN